MVALNVAINSHNNVLLTLLISNNFTELKISVFKRVEVENLFQIACADACERFQISVYLTIVALQACRWEEGAPGGGVLQHQGRAHAQAAAHRIAAGPAALHHVAVLIAAAIANGHIAHDAIIRGPACIGRPALATFSLTAVAVAVPEAVARLFPAPSTLFLVAPVAEDDAVGHFVPVTAASVSGMQGGRVRETSEGSINLSW